jgi:hypothetical protein
MNWEKTRLDLGEVKQGSSKKFIFKATKDLDISSIKLGCNSCTKAKYKDRILNVTFTPQNIPVHISLTQNWQRVAKIIVIKYSNGTEETLTFTAKIVK